MGSKQRRAKAQSSSRRGASQDTNTSLSTKAVWVAVAGCLALAVVLTLVFFVIPRRAVSSPTLAWFGEKTTHAPGGIPSMVRARVGTIADTGGGRLEVYAVGEKLTQVGQISLTVSRDGDSDPDPQHRHAVIGNRMSDLAVAVDRADVGATGFSIYSALQGMADAVARTGGHLEVWWSTAVLTGSTDPLSMGDLESFAEPRDAADTLLNGPLGNLDLHGIVLHPIMLTPVGDGQGPLSPRSEMWRSAFVTDLTSGLGAKVLPPIHDGSTPRAWSHSSSVEPISPRPDITPTSPQEPDTLKISDVGFVPDTATLINPDDARRRLDKIVQAYRQSHDRKVVEVTGYCAHYGNQGTARTLSRQRAATIASLLRDIGAIPAADIATPAGVGFDQLADPRQPPRSAAQRVVVVRLQPTHSPS